MTNGKTKVAILGGGMGALSAAWELLQQDPDAFDITIYQRGSRLGGKGASGRNMTPGKGRRVEEHGLHILMGFYDNAFQVLKSVYDEQSDLFGPWDKALTGSDHLHLPDYYADGTCEFWELEFPSDATKKPGARPPGELPDTLEIFAHVVDLLLKLQQKSDVDDSTPADADTREAVKKLRPFRSKRTKKPGRIARETLQWAIRRIVRFLFARVTAPEARDAANMARRRRAMAGYFVGANLIGIIEHRLWEREDYLRALPELDEMDYKRWLRKQCDFPDILPHLAWESPVVNSLYDLIFSRCPGCPGEEPGFGAGTALYDSLLITMYYWGHVFYRMNGGMGDVVFAPLYEHLKRRVSFRFFHTVKELGVSDGRIDRIVVESRWDGDYEPLFDCKGRRCWKQPEPGDPPPGNQDPVERTLLHGTDFDVVVLGISVGGLREERLTGALREASPRFAQMVSGLRTVPTQALQLWFTTDPAGLGWLREHAMMGGFRRPFQAWADMYQVLPHECWEEDGINVKSVAYLCDAYSGPPSGAAEHVHREARQWLEGPAHELWPKFDWNLLAGSTATGALRLDDQFWCANVDPSDAYVLAAPRTSKLRLAADESGFDNLYLAGDWTRTELNAGCLEAATMSGRAAARAIAGKLQRRAALSDPYLDQDSDWVLKHPVLIRDARATFLAFEGGEAATAYCRTLVHRMSGGAFTVEPLSILGINPIFMLCAQLPSVSSADPEHSSLGFFSENDVGILIPVTLERVATSERFRGLICPYLFVDSPIGLSAGREIFGLPKALAKIDITPQTESQSFAVDVTADVLPAGGTEPPQVRQELVIRIVRAAAADSTNESGMLTAVRNWLWPDPSTPRKIPLFLGKQVRDASRRTDACYRALMRCDLELTNVQGVDPSLARFDVSLPEHGKPRIAATLGLETEFKAMFSLQAHFDLTFPEAEILARTEPL